jgi:RNA polymerase sigma factor (sigma-70 family)
MDDRDWLARRFEAHRSRLRAVAYRMLGSSTEADDAVQETWLRLSRTDVDAVDNLAGWLTTVVARVSLNMLQARTTRREEPAGQDLPDPVSEDGDDPEQQALQAEGVGLALLVVLDTLTPAERLAFVLHDLFAVPFEEIAPILDRSPAAARQLASRARRRVRGAELPDATERRREVVAAFLDAARNGEFSALLELLHPEAVLRSDAVATRMGSEAEVRGATAVARFLSGRARAARLVLVDGVPGAVWSLRGAPQVVFAFTVEDGVVTAIDLLAAPETLAGLDLQPLGQR